jgi:hypothetical protein
MGSGREVGRKIRRSQIRSERERRLVELTGIEPATS